MLLRLGAGARLEINDGHRLGVDHGAAGGEDGRLGGRGGIGRAEKGDGEEE